MAAVHDDAILCEEGPSSYWLNPAAYCISDYIILTAIWILYTSEHTSIRSTLRYQTATGNYHPGAAVCETHAFQEDCILFHIHYAKPTDVES